MVARIMLVAAVALFVLAGWFVFATTRTQDEPPKAQIQQTLEDAVTAYNTGRVWDALRIVSADYSDNTGLTREQLTALVSRYRVEAPDAMVSIEKADIQTAGEEATVPMEVALSGLNRQKYSVTLHMKRESVRAYGVIPVQRWRVNRVEGVPELRDFP